MSALGIIMIAFALAMDAFAVSVASGIAIKQLRLKHAFTIAAWFGIFQALMPVLGWLGGMTLSRFLSGLDHWIAFGLLAFVGVKMIYEAFKIEAVEKKANPLEIYLLFVLSLATSIDAFAVGISLAMLKLEIVKPVIVIGGVTFATSFAGVYLGRYVGHFFEKKIEVVGGLILLAIGAKILLDHIA